MRNQITFECTVCKERNYTGSRNKKSKQEKIELSKYCPRCRKHTRHKETK